MSKILITGASGFLGTKLLGMYSSQAEVVGTYKNHPREGMIQLDVTDPAQTRRVITSFHPDTVIHTVAISDPDVCEQERDEAEKINYLGTKNVVDACREIGARLDYISTVYVFDGQKGHYVESDDTHPVNWYGETKLRAEREVATLPQYGIYRFDKLYGYNGEGLPNDAFSKIESGKPFEVNSDQIRQPIFVDDVGRAIQLVQRQGLDGVFHLAGPDNLTKYALTVRLGRLVGKESLVLPIPEVEQIARRPKDSSLVTKKAEGLDVRFTPLAEGLSIIEKQLSSTDPEGKRRRV